MFNEIVAPSTQLMPVDVSAPFLFVLYFINAEDTNKPGVRMCGSHLFSRICFVIPPHTHHSPGDSIGDDDLG